MKVRLGMGALFLIGLPLGCSPKTQDEPQQEPVPVARSGAKAAPATSTSDAVAEGKNVILISLDTCRADSLGFYGAERKTPALDRLAEGALVFTDCFAQSSVTGPSHMSILTGHYVQRHGLIVNGVSVTPAYTLASLLRDQGYHTAAFTGHGSFQSKFGHGFGFEHFSSETPGNEQNQRNFDETIPEALRWLDEFGDQGPFFLLVHGYDPHLPYWPDEPLRSQFGEWYQGELDPEKLSNKYAFMKVIEEGKLGAEDKRYIRDLYDAEVALADAQLYGFLRDLERRGLMQNSVLVFTSDHGELLGEHDKVGHGPFYREVMHVPLLFRFPDQGLEGRIDQPVEHVDIVPTLLSYLELELPDGLQGYDLTPFGRGEDPIPADRLRIGHQKTRRVLRDASDPNLKVSFQLKKGLPIRLQVYELSKDPGELFNLADDRDLRNSEGSPRRSIGELTMINRRAEAIIERYMTWSKESAAEDATYRGRLIGIQKEDLDMLQALGYAGTEDED